jgi:hypothetical protein
VGREPARDKRDDPVGAEGLAFPVQGQVGNLLHVTEQMGVASRGLAQKGSALRRRALERFLEERFNLLQTFDGYFNMAACQFRTTVSGVAGLCPRGIVARIFCPSGVTS